MLLRPRTWYWVEDEDLGVTAPVLHGQICRDPRSSNRQRAVWLLKEQWDSRTRLSLTAYQRLRSKILAEEQSLLSKLGKVSGSVR